MRFFENNNLFYVNENKPLERLFNIAGIILTNTLTKFGHDMDDDVHLLIKIRKKIKNKNKQRYNFRVHILNFISGCCSNWDFDSLATRNLLH